MKKKFETARARHKAELDRMDEAQVLCRQAQLYQDVKFLKALLEDCQIRLDYLGRFTPSNILNG